MEGHYVLPWEFRRAFYSELAKAGLKIRGQPKKKPILEPARKHHTNDWSGYNRDENYEV